MTLNNLHTKISKFIDIENVIYESSIYLIEHVLICDSLPEQFALYGLTLIKTFINCLEE